MRMVSPFSNDKMWIMPTTGIVGCHMRATSGHAAECRDERAPIRSTYKHHIFSP